MTLKQKTISAISATHLFPKIYGPEKTFSACFVFFSQRANWKGALKVVKLYELRCVATLLRLLEEYKESQMHKDFF